MESQPLTQRSKATNNTIMHFYCTPVALKPLTIGISALALNVLLNDGSSAACGITKNLGMVLSVSGIISGICVGSCVSTTMGIDAIQQYKKGANKIDKLIQFGYYVGVPLVGTALSFAAGIQYLTMKCQSGS